jgi:hypothetical protein
MLAMQLFADLVVFAYDDQMAESESAEKLECAR